MKKEISFCRSAISFLQLVQVSFYHNYNFGSSYFLFNLLFIILLGLASQRASWMDDNGVKFDICMVEEAGKLNET